MAVEDRNRKRKKVGLALGSGVARGLAHIGVLQVLEKERIPVDMVTGTSIGAVIGGLHAIGKSNGDILEMAREVGSHRLTYLIDPNIPRSGIIRGKKIEDRLKEFFGDAEFKDCLKPFVCIATDIDQGEEVTLREGLLWEAVRASISLPVVMAVAKWKGKYLVDGALVNPVPVNLLRDMGADIVIGVNVIPDRNIRDDKEPGLFTVITQTMHILGYYMVKESLAEADFTLNPEIETFSLTDFHRVDEFVEKGVAAAEEIVPPLKKMLAEYQPVRNDESI